MIYRFPTKPIYDEKYGWQISISPTKKISIRKVSGNLVPTKRGISLTEQQWETVLSRRNDVDKLIDLVRSNPTGTTPPEDKEMVDDLFLCSC